MTSMWMRNLKSRVSPKPEMYGIWASTESSAAIPLCRKPISGYSAMRRSISSVLLTSVDISIVIGVIRLQDVAALSTRLEKLVDVNTASAAGIDINKLF